MLAGPAGANLTVHSDSWPYRYVSVEGTATVIRDRVVADLHHVAERYLGGLLQDAYVQTVKSDGVIARLEVGRLVDVDFR